MSFSAAEGDQATITLTPLGNFTGQVRFFAESNVRQFVARPDSQGRMIKEMHLGPPTWTWDDLYVSWTDSQGLRYVSRTVILSNSAKPFTIWPVQLSAKTRAIRVDTIGSVRGELEVVIAYYQKKGR